MTVYTIPQIIEFSAEVVKDCTADALRLDATPFTPLGLGTALGQILAMVSVLAQMVHDIAEELA